ncbi:MAG: DNA mismatch repair endonuclease MutL, partial [Desulfatitalea sp.]|nr:DNA mismatch repair endonuclease MutL [Desulfatitalea sp.]
PEELSLAVLSHATSKLLTADDLFKVTTFGFRGEALPSMAAVSHLTLVTRTADSESGVEVHVKGGKIERVIDTGAPKGTLIRVKHLFFNTPARRKFLKTTVTEMAHIGDAVAGMALGYSTVFFKLVHNGKTVKQWPRMNDAAERAADVLGHIASGDLIQVVADEGPVTLKGYLAPARLARSTSRGTYLFVNGRRVRDRTIQHALFEGFHGRLMRGRFPLAVLFLAVPYDQVDVNVHPTKHEIRFADQRRIHRMVQQAVGAALARAEHRPRHSETTTAATVPEHHVAESAAPYVAQHTGEKNWDAPQAHRAPSPLATFPSPDQMLPKAANPMAQKRPPTPTPDQAALWQSHGFADLTVIGQFRGTYIICQDGDDLILIDQHAAHERIVYEQLGRRKGRIESQQLLVPETMELGFSEARMLEQLITDLDQMGLEIEPFGGTTFVVKAIPTVLDDQNAERLVRDLVERSLEIGMDAGTERILDACRAVMACHNAVRANQRLVKDQMHQMLNQLDQCDTPSHCPHGRPTWVRWTRRDLEKAFGRTG